METRVAEVADGTYQLTTYLEEMDFAVNQYLLTGDEPLLFHTGMRGLFPLVAEAVARCCPRVAALDRLRSRRGRRVRLAEPVARGGARRDGDPGRVGCMVSIGDLADRPPRPLEPGEKLDLGGHCVEWIDTPHVPHAWEAGVLFDHTTGTLLCGDLFSQNGNYAPTTTDDIVGPAVDAEDGFPSMSLHPATGSIIRGLADLDPTALALMHGPVFTGDCAGALRGLADDADRRVAREGHSATSGGARGSRAPRP